jgi:hypothetical protein
MPMFLRFLSIVLISVYSSHAFAQLFSISEPLFSIDYDYTTNEPIGIVSGANVTTVDRSVFSSGKVVFSFDVIGASELLSRIENQQGLEIRVRVECDNHRPEIILVSMSQRQWLRDRDELTSEVRNHGLFDWGTLAIKRNYACREMRYRVLDENSATVRPPGGTRIYTRVLRFLD